MQPNETLIHTAAKWSRESGNSEKILQNFKNTIYKAKIIITIIMDI